MVCDCIDLDRLKLNIDLKDVNIQTEDISQSPTCINQIDYPISTIPLQPLMGADCVNSELKNLQLHNLHPQVRQLHRHNPAPVWLKSLLAAQKVSMILFGSVFGLSSIVYGYTMHTQTTWRTQQDQLRRWQNQERHQGVMNENLKQVLAKTAEAKGSGLVDPKPQMAVFVHSASPRQPKPLPAMAKAPKPIPVSKIPSGY
jgi:hypothetical protein